MQIHLRRFGETDLAAFQSYRTDPDLARYQGWQVETDIEAARFLKTMSGAPALQKDVWIQLAICRSDLDEVIGDVGLCHDGTNLELGYTLNRHFQGQGLATAAVRMAVLWAEFTCRANAYIGITDARNTHSINLLERLGFDYTRRSRDGNIVALHYALTPQRG